MTDSIDTLHAYISTDETGEGVTSFYSTEMGWMPMVGADQARIESLEPIAQSLASDSGRRIVLAEFSNRTDVKILEPNGAAGVSDVITLNAEDAAGVARQVEELKRRASNVDIVVVTKVPDGEKIGGNVAMAGFDLLWSTGERDETTHLDKTVPLLDALVEMLGDERMAAGFMLNLRQQVFQLGEIMFLDGAHGRELTGAGRKPSKWFIETETVDTIDEAIALSQRVVREAEEAKQK
jgi:hypothetical protein